MSIRASTTAFLAVLLALGGVSTGFAAEEATLGVSVEVVSSCEDLSPAGRLDASRSGACRPLVAPQLAPEPYVLSPELEGLRRAGGETERSIPLPMVTVVY